MSDFNHPYSQQDTPYKVPDGYFAQKQKDLLAIADEKTARATSVRQLSWISGAVAAAMIIAVFVFPENSSVELSTEYMEDYIISEYNYGFTEEVLFYELSGQEIATEDGWQLTDQAMEEFLDNNFDQTLHYEYY